MKLSEQMKQTLQTLVDLVGGDHIQEIEIERGIFGRRRIRVVGGRGQVVQSAVPISAVPQASEPAASAQAEAAETEALHTITSPMVGMFYRAPGPETPAFVEEGDVVSPGQTLCIIEAMKIMNEIEADIKGRVVRILVENSNPVEYNTPLFLLEPL